MNHLITRGDAAKTFLATAAGGMMSGGASPSLGVDLQDSSEERIRTDVCVIGGGSGGTGAALAAARVGAKVVLLEREATLGGTGTCAFVNVWRPVTGCNGIARDIFDTMVQDPMAVTLPPDSDLDAFYAKSQLGPRHVDGKDIKPGADVAYEPRAMDFAVRSLLDATGRCRTLLGTTFCRAHRKGDSN